MDILGKRLKWLREQKRYAQKEVAAEIGMKTVNGYQKIEYGERVPKLDVLIKLANFYDVSVDFIVGNSDHTNILLKKKELLVGYINAQKHLISETNNIVLDNDVTFGDTVYRDRREVLDLAIMSFNHSYFYTLSEYIKDYIQIPDNKPYENSITKGLFPIKYKTVEEMNHTFSVRLITKDGKDIDGQFTKRFSDYNLAKKEEEHLNNYVKKFWVDGVEPETGDIQVYLF